MRATLSLVLLGAVILGLGAARMTAQDTRKATGAARSVHDFEVQRIDGVREKLAAYKGKVALVVNVASECGYTPQYAGLQKLHEKYSARGFTVLGFPSNDFGAQEPGSDQQILEFCHERYSVTFPLFSKVKVLGPEASPLYRYLQEDGPKKATVKWNFHKFLIDGEGNPIASFGTKVPPDDATLVAAIEGALPRTASTSKPASQGGAVKLLIVAFDGLKLPDGSTFSLAAENEKRIAALKAGRKYEPPPAIRWHWRYPSGLGEESAAKHRALREANPLAYPAEGDFLFYDPESMPGFTEADFSDVQAGGDQSRGRSVRFSIKPERRDAFARYTAKWNDQGLALVVKDEIMATPVIRGPIRDAVEMSAPGGFSPKDQQDLIDRLRAAK